MIKILIVDDEKELCEGLAEFFNFYKGLRVWTASAPEKALKMIQEVQPHILLLDIHLNAESDGMHILRRMPQISPLTQTIIVTANIAFQSLSKAKELGAVDYITKPFSLEYLDKTVKRKIRNVLETIAVS